MTRHETILKISHYEWMLESLSLTIKHELWVQDQLKDLNALLAKFHPESHPHHKCKEAHL